MKTLRNKVAGLISPRALCERITAEVARDCEAAQAVFPDGEPHEWLQLAFMTRMNTVESLLPTNMLRAMAIDATRIISTIGWPDSARALGFYFFMQEHPGIGGSDPYIAGERSAYWRLLAQHEADRELSRSLYLHHNPRLGMGYRRDAPASSTAAEDLAEKVVLWADGGLTDDQLFVNIDLYRVVKGIPPAAFTVGT
jgi:hypothetical protein